jgi:UDP-2-acetamido-3-amino-2,3-dideoxy-glucuronate N-acetyltransferase
MIDATAKVHPSAIVDTPCTIGDGAAVWHFSHVREDATIGANAIIGQNCYIGKGVQIGRRCKIQNNVSVYEDVTLEDEVFCGPSCVFTNVINPRAAIDRKAEFKPTHVRRGATIGANATIICGVTIGRWAMIGAGAVIRQNVPDFALVVGVPSKRIGWVTVRGETIPRLLVGESFKDPADGRVYKLESVTRLRLVSPEPEVEA